MPVNVELGLNTKSAGKVREIATEVGALLFGDFTLASGKKSSYYFDGKKLTLSPQGAYWVGKAIFEELAKISVDAVGGVAVGGYPIATAVAVVSYLEGKPIPSFMVREVAKEHGTKKQIEGHLKEGFNVVIVEDVVTTGGSVIKTIETVEAANCKVVKVIAILDRHEGGSDNLKQKGYDFSAILNIWPSKPG